MFFKTLEDNVLLMKNWSHAAGLSCNLFINLKFNLQCNIANNSTGLGGKISFRNCARIGVLKKLPSF